MKYFADYFEVAFGSGSGRLRSIMDGSIDSGYTESLPGYTESLPGYIESVPGDTNSSPLEKFCSHERYPSLIAWVYLNIIMAYAIPIIMMVFCYGCILWRVLNPRIPSKQSSINNDSAKCFLKRRHSLSSSSNSQRRNQRVTVLVVSRVVHI